MNVHNKIQQKDDILSFLLQHKDDKYRDFNSKLIPTTDKNNIIGVRIPVIRKLAKELKGTTVAKDFLSSLPHTYLEENHLHAFLIETIQEFDEALLQTELFLPYIDNWSVCDSMRPKIFKKHPQAVMDKIRAWLKSDKVYTVRYAIGLLNSFYLDDNFKEEQLSLVSSIKSDEYYINMMIAWYFATALCKQYECTVKYIEEQKLTKWTHNKAITKARESLRIDKETKKYLNTLKIK